MRATASLVGMVVLLAGCITGSPTELEEGTSPSPERIAGRAVVALVDTGINPWHEAFALQPEAAATPPGNPEVVPRAFRAEWETRGLTAWNDLALDTLYWFEGTRVLGISMIRNFDPLIAEVDPHRIYDDINHGTATASVVARTSPHAWILMIETDALYLDALLWAAEQPWIDVISISVGPIGHVPSNVTNGPDPNAQALRAAVDSGKLVVDAAGNEPDPNLLSHSGAPWAISVGGAEEDRHGIVALSSRPVDVVTNFTGHDLARNNSDNATFTAKGTSFGAPLVAGVLAEALHEVRARWGDGPGVKDGALVRGPHGELTNRDVRAALNLSARYWTTTDWDPTTANLTQSPFRLPYEATIPAGPHVPGTPLGPWVAMGWGYVDASTTTDIVAVLLGEQEPPDKRDAATYMDALHDARSAAWDLYQRRPLAAREGFQENA